MALRFSPDGERVVIGSALEASLSVHEAVSGRKIWRLSGRGATSPSWSGLEWSPDGKQIAVASMNWGTDSRWAAGPLRVHDARDGRVLREWSQERFGSLAWSRDGKSIAVQVSPPQDDDEGAVPFVPSPTTIEVRDARGGQVLQTLRGTPDKINAIQQSPDRMRWAACGRDGAVRVWNADGVLAHEMRAHAGEARDLAWKTNGILVSVGDDGTTRFWNARTGRLAATVILLQEPGAVPRPRQPRGKVRGRARDFGGGVFEELPPAQWLMWTPEGFYNASARAEKFVRWRVGERLFPASRYKNLFRPEAVH
jgi:WD40 repeat protein